jgi:hypothetical protein
MSEENVGIVLGAIAYEYYGVGDRAEAAAIFDPEVVLNPIDEAPSSGFAAMRADMGRRASAFNELEVSTTSERRPSKPPGFLGSPSQ